MTTIKNTGPCQYPACGRENQKLIPVHVGMEVILICSRHGASTNAVYDVFSENYQRRARVHEMAVGYHISLMDKHVFADGSISYRSRLYGRQSFKKLLTATRYCNQFVNIT